MSGVKPTKCEVCDEKGTAEIPTSEAHVFDRYEHVEGTSTHQKVCVLCGRMYGDAEDCVGDWTYAEEGHSRTCTVCQNNETVGHDFTGKPVHNGDDTHVYSCVADGCSATKTETCVENDIGKCAKCDYFYGDIVIVHFHKPTDWSAVAIYAYYGTSNTPILGNWPGTDANLDDEGDGWFTIEFSVKSGLATTGFTIILNNNGAGKQTENIAVNATEIWVSRLGLAAHTSKEAAEDEENGPIPTASDWIIVGHFGGEDHWSATTNIWGRVFAKDSDYTIEITFVANDSFKIKQNVDNWDDAIGYGGNWTFSGKADSVEGNVTKLLAEDNDGNFAVKYACTLRITFNPTSKALSIYIVSATGLPAVSQGATDEYVIVGKFNGVDKWGDGDGYLMQYDSATMTYVITDFVFKLGDQWKIKLVGDGEWKWQINGGSTKRITYSTAKQPQDALFGGSGESNIEVNYDCTVTIRLNVLSKSLEIEVTAIDIPDVIVEYNYNFHVYVPTNVSMSSLQVHIWGVIEPTGWNTGAMTKDASNDGWWTFTYTSKVKYSGQISLIIHNGDTKYAVFNDGAGTGPAITLAEDLYFIYNKNNAYYTTKEDALAAAGVRTAQVALPLKWDLLAA